MAETNMRLSVMLSVMDRALAPLKRIGAGSAEAAKQLKATKDRLKELNAQQGSIGDFRKARTGLEEVSAKLQEAQRKVGELARGFGAVGPPTRAMAREMAAAKKEAAQLGQQYDTQRAKVQSLRDRLSQAGISTRELSSNERRLRGDIAGTTAEIARQTQQLKAQADTQRKLDALKSRHAKTMMHTGMAVGAGYGMQHVGASMRERLAAPMGEGKRIASEQTRIASLGLGDAQTQEAVRFAREMKTYGTSQADNMELMRDAITVFSDTHHAEMVTPLLARMKFANEAVYGAQHGEENEKRFMDMLKVIELRGGLSSQQAFERQANIVQQVLTATGGRVGPEEWLNLIKTGGVAAKGIKDEAFYYQLEPLVQEMGGNRVGTALMSAYQNIYQGKTTKRAAVMLDKLGLIADPSKVKHDKVGQVAQLGVGALKGSDLFRENQFEWMERVLLPQLAAKGITEKQQILDVMGGIFSNRTASGLFAQMYLQREQIHKNEKLNAGADGVDALHAKAMKLPSGAEIEAQKRLRDVQAEFSEAVMPVYVKALEVATDALKGLLSLMREYPAVTKVVGVGLGGLSLLLTGLGALLVPMALIAGKALLLRFIFARLGLSLGAGGLLGKLAGFAMAVARVAWPFALLGTAAWMVYRNWDDMVGGARLLWQDLTGWLSQLWADMQGGAMAAWQDLGAWLSGLWAGIAGGAQAIWQDLSARLAQLWADMTGGARMAWADLSGMVGDWMTLGGQLIDGLINGITGKLGQLRDTVVGAASAATGWFKEKLGIKSPSRVFMELGGFISEGAALGIERGQAGVRAAALAMAAAAAAPAAMAGQGLGMLGVAPLQFDTRGPLGPQPAAAPVAAGGAISITIHAAPGMDPQELARAVARELDRREREQRTRSLSRLHDMD